MSTTLLLPKRDDYYSNKYIMLTGTLSPQEVCARSWSRKRELRTTADACCCRSWRTCNQGASALAQSSLNNHDWCRSLRGSCFLQQAPQHPPHRFLRKTRHRPRLRRGNAGAAATTWKQHSCHAQSVSALRASSAAPHLSAPGDCRRNSASGQQRGSAGRVVHGVEGR